MFDPTSSGNGKFATLCAFLCCVLSAGCIETQFNPWPSDAESADGVENDAAVVDVAHGDGAGPAGDGLQLDGIEDGIGDAQAGCPGAAGCPCQKNLDCLQTGSCVATADGSRCSAKCKSCNGGDCQVCPAGYSCGSGKVTLPDGATATRDDLCLPRWKMACVPCLASKDCSSPGDPAAVCVSLGEQPPGRDGYFCAPSCAQDVDCPPGYGCQLSEVIDANALMKRCRPLNHTCTCSTVATVGAASTSCFHMLAGVGSCVGKRTCSAKGLSACDAAVPATETCNGSDDDCDGFSDNKPNEMCVDDSVCTTDSCSGKQGCAHLPLSGTCVDGDVCTGGEQCDAGKCVGVQVSCDDGNPCTLDSCDPGTGCNSLAIDGGCSDGDICSIGDHCANSTCANTGSLNCDDANVCTSDSCDKGKGCVHLPSGGTCSDGDVCSAFDQCAAGSCIAKPTVCDDGDGCTLDSCTAKVGCTSKIGDAKCGQANVSYLNSFSCNSAGLSAWKVSPSAASDLEKQTALRWQVDATPILLPSAASDCSLNVNNGLDLKCLPGELTATAQADSPRLDATGWVQGSALLLRVESAGSWGAAHKAEVLVSTDDIVWKSLFSLPPTGAVWGKIQFALGAYAGSKFRLRMRFSTSDCADVAGTGWFLRNLTVEVDACAQKGVCDVFATCKNANGAAVCTCFPGYAGNGFTCKDVDECLVNNGGCENNKCNNYPGTFSCGCLDGFTGSFPNCSDVDECAVNNGGCSSNAVCSNSPGSFACACKNGYSGDAKTCVDVNECLTDNGGCSTNASCTNTDGSLICVCNNGYAGDGKTCTDVDECAKNNGGCSVDAVCTNALGKFTCVCKAGFIGNGVQCQAYGGPALPAVNCAAILKGNPAAASGLYWLFLAGAPVQVYCDMLSDGGGWARVDYKADLVFQQQLPSLVGWYWLPQNFATVLTAAQIAALQAVSSEGKQTYVGLCNHVIHYYYTGNATYNWSFGFRFSDNSLSLKGTQSYAPIDIAILQDGCKGYAAEGGAPALATIFSVKSTKVPIINVMSRNGGYAGGKFGSPLLQNPAWLR